MLRLGLSAWAWEDQTEWPSRRSAVCDSEGQGHLAMGEKSPEDGASAGCRDLVPLWSPVKGAGLVSPDPGAGADPVQTA